ncbi:hypothetical protein F0562_006165 [Nyssa sinensis]|uniref:Uncharacterized protein n=1 Tax=Nyssa sinensis TaxID=561372 RepID=A0A5J5AP09_9ASTE|nr:hypothetical protein F0562_006165 [Nyssa sinensis]
MKSKYDLPLVTNKTQCRQGLNIHISKTASIVEKQRRQNLIIGQLDRFQSFIFH